MWLAAWTMAKSVGKWLAGTQTGRIVLLLIALAGTHLWAYHHGKANVQAEWDKTEKARKEKAETAAKQQKAEQDKIVADLKEELRLSKEQTEKVKVIIKEVPKYVTQKADAACTFTRGFEWVYNVPLDPGLAGSPPGDVDAPTTLKASEVAAVSAENNAECVERGKIIDAWQEWYTRSRDAFLKAKKASESP